MFDPHDPQTMQRKPQYCRAPLLSWRTCWYLLSVGILLSLGVAGACYYGLGVSADMGQTMAFTTLVLFEFVRLQMVRVEYRVGFFSNYWALGALVLSLLMKLALLYVPFFQKMFRTVSLDGTQWTVIAGIIMVVWFVYLLLQYLFYARKRKERSSLMRLCCSLFDFSENVVGTVLFF